MKFTPPVLRHLPPLGHMDVVRMSDGDVLKLTTEMKSLTPDYLAQKITNPALETFTYVAVDHGNRIDFERKFSVLSIDTRALDFTPLIEARMSRDSELRYVFHAGLVSGELDVRAAYICDPSVDLSDADDLADSVFSTYAMIQHVLCNRPEVFRTSTVRTEAAITKHNKKHKRGKRKVKTYRVITLDADYTPQPKAKGGAGYACPCWGVIGHVRKYKNGKTVWIKPYKKGKQRNNPDAYSGKEYELEVRAHGIN